MSRGYGDNRGRREGRRRDGGYRDYREPRIMPLGTPFPHDPPPDYTSEPDYPRGYPREAEYQHRPAERSNPPPLRRRGLNEDYYNSGRDEHETPRHHRKERSSRRGNHRHEDLRRDDHRRDDHRRGDHRHEEHRRSRTTNGDFADDYFQPKHKRRDDDNDEVSDDYSQPKPRRRAKTESRGRHRERSSRRHSDDRHSDDKRYESMPETPSKPKRGRSFLNAIGINKAEKPIERGRSPARSLSRGRRDSSYSRSPPRRHRSARGHDKRSSRARDGGPGLKHSNTQWQRAAARAAQAGATAAFELRNDPSPWMGPKGVRVATAALGAAMVDTFMEDKHPKRGGGMRHRAIRQVSEAALRHVISGRGRSRKRDHY